MPRKNRTAKPRSNSTPSPIASPPGPDDSGEDWLTRRRKIGWALALLVVQACVATWGQFDFGDLMGYYNMFAEGLLAGHLYIQHTPDQVNLIDMIPFEGRYYLQWGPLPVLFHLLALPFGLALSDRVACILAGWLTALVFLEIMLLLRRRYFPDLSLQVCFWFYLAFALATPAALVTYRGTIYSESIAIAALAVMLGLYALLRFGEREESRWILLCGICIAAALLTRVTMALYGAVFFPAIAFLLRRRKGSWIAAIPQLSLFVIPVVTGIALMLGYNQARFGSLFDYGNSYKPGATSHYAPFSLLRVPENLRHYLLSLPEISSDFPWINHDGWTPLQYTSRAEAMSSILLASVFLVFAALAWRVFRRDSNAAVELKIITAATAAGGVSMFAVMMLFSAASRRYAHDFVPMFMVLAVIGAATLPNLTDLWERWRPAAYGVLAVSALLHAQIAFYQSFHTPVPDLNVVRTFVALNPAVRSVLPGPRAEQEEAIARNDLGTIYLRQGSHSEALSQFEQAASLLPDSEHIQKNLAIARRLVEGR